MTTRLEFNNCIECQEQLNWKGDDMKMWLRNKYAGMRLHALNDDNVIDEKPLMVGISAAPQDINRNIPHQRQQQCRLVRRQPAELLD